LVGARPGLGTFVLRTLSSTDPGEREDLARGLAEWIREARDAGLVREDIEALYGAAMRESFQESETVA
jgi:GntR family transcriptional regulator